MNLEKKIEEIRQKPEHIRMRYVWGLVALSFIFILAVWFFSFWGRTTTNKIQNEEIKVFNDLDEKKRSLDEYKNQINDFKENFENLTNTVEEGAVNLDGEEEIVQPVGDFENNLE